MIVPYEVDHLYAWAKAENAAELRIASINVDDVTDLTSAEAKLAEELSGWRKLEIPLQVGNENNIEVMAYGMDADGNKTETRVRTIVNVVRLPEKYLPPELEYIGVSEGTLTSVYHGSIHNYNVTVPYDVSEVDVDILATIGETSAKLVGGKNISVLTDPATGKAVDTFSLKVGENVVRIYLYDDRPIPDGGYPYYIGVYSVVIHRMSKDGIQIDLADGVSTETTTDEETGETTTVETALSALTATQRVKGSDGTVTETKREFTTDFAFNEYNYYLYVSEDADSVFFTANAAHKDAVITVNGHAKDTGKDGWTVNLAQSGDTQAIVNVTAADGSMKNYTVTIIRGNDDFAIAGYTEYPWRT